MNKFFNITKTQSHYNFLSRILLIRRIPLVLFFVFAFQINAELVHSQDKKISLDIKNSTIEKVLQTIEGKSDYHFLYSNRLINVDKTVSVKVENATISSVLDRIFNSNEVDYEVKGSQIVLSPKKKNETTSVQSESNQKLKTITGTIVDSNGEPIIGANIIERGTTNGTITDFNGKFTLSVSNNAVLKTSYIGYLEQEVATLGKNSINLVLQEDRKTLDEVVVVGYGTQKKQNLTGATSSIKMDDVLGDRPVTNVTSALKGSIPGLQITSSTGEPGAGNSISIRGGTSSINGGSPLVLVDNVEMDINMLDPNDIESVSVLKDAASSAIYGARAAFGVVLITTKKGLKDDKFKLDYSNNFAFSKPTNLPKKATPLQMVSLYKNVGVTNWNDNNVDTWLGLLNEYEKNPSAYPDGFTSVGNVRYNLKEYDSVDNMMSSFGFQQSHNISATGGNAKSSYRMSFGYINEDGILVTNKDSYNRYNLSAYLTSNAIKWIKPELDVKYTSSQRQMPETNAQFGIWGAAVAFHSYYPLGTNLKDGVEYNYNSPSYLIEKSYPTTTDIENIRLAGKVTITPTKDLNIIGEYTVNKQFSDITKFNPIFTYMRAQDNVLENSTTPSESKFYHTSENKNYNALNIYGNYSHSIKEHNLTMMAGYNQEGYFWKQFYETRAEMINQNLPSISGGVGEIYTDDAYSEYTTRSGFYRFNYDFAGKYLFETNGRYDGSSKFPKTSRFGFFPSLSAGWRVSEEKFMDWSKDFLGSFKLRASWGNIGNQNINPYVYIPGMSPNVANWIINNKRVYTLGMPPLVSSSFTWEKVETLNLGTDISVFNNRLNLTYDWYQRDTKGMLTDGSELPSVLGTGAPKENVANLRTQGWELAIQWKDKIGQVNYNLGFNLFDSNTKITKFDNQSGLLSQYYVGMDVNEQWGYTTDRFYTNEDFGSDGKLKEGIAKVEGYTPNAGDILYIDYNGDGVINSGSNTLDNPGDRKIIGNKTRHYQYGITGGAQWKGLAVSFILQGVGKRDIWYSNELFFPWYDEWSTLMSSQLDYWTPENTNAYFPRVYEKAKGNSNANRLTQTKYKQNGAYLSIKNITLSYSLPKSIIENYKINSLSIFTSVEDLKNFNHLPQGMDAEAGVKERGWTYPYLTKWSLGLRIGL